jgi:hypothetical protein
LIPDGKDYTFSVSNGQSNSTTVESFNVFKKNPGVGGMSRKNTTENPVPGSTVKLFNPSGQQVGSSVSDEDGYYQIDYKHTGKAATYTVKMVPPGGSQQTKSVALKANGYVQVDFTVP